MTSVLEDSDSTWADLLRTWNELDAAAGWRPEIISGGIHMSPPPSGEHNVIAALLTRSLCAGVDEGVGVFQTLGVAVRSVGSIFIPDLCVVDLLVPRGTRPIDSEHVLLAVEITSPGNAEHDRKLKKWAYAHGGIPQYVLIDAFDEGGPSVWVFSQPAEGSYRSAVRTPFGKPITLADPVALDIDSSLFPTF